MSGLLEPQSIIYTTWQNQRRQDTAHEIIMRRNDVTKFHNAVYMYVSHMCYHDTLCDVLQVGPGYCWLLAVEQTLLRSWPFLVLLGRSLASWCPSDMFGSLILLCTRYWTWLSCHFYSYE